MSTFFKNIKKSVRIVIAIVIAVLTVCSIVDLGYVCRTLSFLPLYLFGFLSYFVAALFLYVAYRVVFIESEFRIRKRSILFLAITALGVGMLFCYLMSSKLIENEMLTISNWGEPYSTIFSNFYKNVGAMFLYNDPNHLKIGGGMIGYFFVGMFNSIFNSTVGSLVIAISLTVIGVVLLFLPDFIKYLKEKKKQKETEPNDVKKIEMKPKKEKIKKEKVNKVKIKDKTRAALHDASKLDDSRIETNVNHFIVNGASSISEQKGLKRSEFAFDDNEEKNEYVEESEITITPIVEEKIPEIKLTETINEEEKSDIVEELFDNENKIEEPSLNETHSSFEEYIEKEPEEEIEEPKPIVEEVKKKERINFIPPSSDLLDPIKSGVNFEINNQHALRQKQILEDNFAAFGIGAYVDSYIIGPAVTRYNIMTDPGVSTLRIEQRIQDLNRALGGVPGRFEHVVTNEIYSGYEVPNAKTEIVYYRECFEGLPDANEKPLAIPIGKDLGGHLVSYEYNKFPHLLIAGATMSGKSVFVKALLLTLIMRNSPDDLKIILVDPKVVEFSLFKGIPHLLTPIVDSPEKAHVCLDKLIDEMEKRYHLFSDYEVVNIKDYNELMKEQGKDTLPYILFAVDEFADLSKDKYILEATTRLAAKARACGIHLLIATQRPDTSVISGTLKGNIPTHLCFRVASATDSIVVIGKGGGEKLLNNGDSLFEYPGLTGLTRCQGAFVKDEEVKRVVKYLKTNYPVEYDPNFVDLEDHSKDAFIPIPGKENIGEENKKVEKTYDDLVAAVELYEYISQQKILTIMGCGFTKAGKLMSQLIQDGIVDFNYVPGRGNRVLKHNNGYVEGNSRVASYELTSFDEGFTQGKRYDEPSDDIEENDNENKEEY